MILKILHKIDDFFYSIFPSLKGKENSFLTEYIENFYSIGLVKPTVSITGDIICIEIDVPKAVSQDVKYKKVVKLCEESKISEAKPILQELIKSNPTVSEYHRILGQIFSEEGNQDDAVDSLIDSLRWNPLNNYSLLMMGNIFAKYKDDFQTARQYFDKALSINPNDNITLNNIGASLIEIGKLDEAKRYLWEAVKINQEYPNTHYALAIISELESDIDSSFTSLMRAVKVNKNKDILLFNSIKKMFEIAKKIVSHDNGKKIFRAYRSKLEKEGETRIDIVEDGDIPTMAKMEFAENYERNMHIIKYKPNQLAFEHLIMHELVHLDFVLKARQIGNNQLFISNQSHQIQFLKGLNSTVNKFKKMGVSEDSISKFCTDLFRGMNSQVFNAPIDVFIESFLFDEYPELRPFQFISLYRILKESVKAVTDKDIIRLSPDDIVSKSKIYNLVGALQFKELYGVDLVKEFKPLPNELRIAQSFYDEFLEKNQQKEPAVEYELIYNWAVRLKLDSFFELVQESEFRNKRLDIDSMLTSIEEDPFETKSTDSNKEREMEEFQESQRKIGTNMAVVMFMIDALGYFKTKTMDEIKKIAFEIALMGTQGYRPEKTDYRLKYIPGKTFSGYHILAYYYVSWAIAVPEMLEKLQLPYKNEYEMALTMFKTGQNE
jgi:tetratricopeptide (TPR) repeat protein